MHDLHLSALPAENLGGVFRRVLELHAANIKPLLPLEDAHWLTRLNVID